MPVLLKLPFAGFYESLWSSEVDHIAQSFAEYREVEERNERAPELRLDASEFSDILFRVTNYSAAYEHLARAYVESFDIAASRELGFKLNLKFESMTSPRFYNFETDRVFAYTSWRAIRAMLKASKAEKHETLARVIKERFTSYDGFLSHYSNDLARWLEKPLRDWDHNELETLLLAAIELSGADVREVEGRAYDISVESNDFDTAHDSAVDWQKFEAEVAELRADKEAEARKLDPDYVAPVERCPFTLDLFRNL